MRTTIGASFSHRFARVPHHYSASAMAETGDQAARKRVILVAVDDSDSSEKALNWAVENVYKDGDEVSIWRASLRRLALSAKWQLLPTDVRVLPTVHCVGNTFTWYEGNLRVGKARACQP